MVKESMALSHVALLVPSVQKAAEAFGNLGLSVQAPEVWEGEGTKEIYVGDYQSQSALPLLMEPVSSGSYLRALKKRGPGIHHVAIDVLNLEKYIHALAGSGWFLHTNSLHTSREIKTAYLLRPGMPTMIEVQEKESLGTAPPVIEGIHLPLNEQQVSMMKALGLLQVQHSDETGVIIKDKKISFKNLV